LPKGEPVPPRKKIEKDGRRGNERFFMWVSTPNQEEGELRKRWAGVKKTGKHGVQKTKQNGNKMLLEGRGVKKKNKKELGQLVRI